jgi:hypothetical protein
MWPSFVRNHFGNTELLALASNRRQFVCQSIFVASLRPKIRADESEVDEGHPNFLNGLLLVIVALRLRCCGRSSLSIDEALKITRLNSKDRSVPASRGKPDGWQAATINQATNRSVAAPKHFGRLFER